MKTEIGKQIKLVTERLESEVREMYKRLDSLETSQSITSEQCDAITAKLKNTKKDIKSLNDKVKQNEERVSTIEGDTYDNIASLDASQQRCGQNVG